MQVHLEHMMMILLAAEYREVTVHLTICQLLSNVIIDMLMM